MRLPLPLAVALALLLALPLAAAKVTVDSIDAPARTAALKAFEVNVTLRNDGPARAVYLFGALYDPDPGRTCGASTDPRFRTFTHVVQERVELPAQSETRYPPEGSRWLHRYEPSDAAVAPEDAQLCVFVANASSGPLIEYESFAASTISVRARNALPVASFSWEPEVARVGEEVRFVAQASDADGDPLAYRWDFGRFDAAGRAVASGERASHAFYPSGTFVVTLYASDGIEQAQVAREVVVRAADEEAPGRSIPLPAILTLAALLVAGAAPRRSRPPRSR